MWIHLRPPSVVPFVGCRFAASFQLQNSPRAIVRIDATARMRLRSLLLAAGAVLPGLGQDIPPSERSADLSEAGFAPKRTNDVAERERRQQQQQQHTSGPRRLQLELQEASREEPLARSDVAYAALLMDDHDRGVRTLGQSLIDSRTSADLVAILGARVSVATETRMRAQGWRIRRLSRGGGVGGGDIDDVSVSVLAHASAWALTEYKRVVLLADNMLVVENIDDLFQCPGICAGMQQAEVLSTSLVVLEPDLETHRHMSHAVGTMYSFSNDFQGFLNSYLAGFETCALFDLENPSLQDPSTDPNRGPDAPLLDHSCHRLPTRYNGDLGLVMLNGGLGMVRTKNPMPEEWWRQRRARVVRYDFAGLRPWMWFASPFLPFVSAWECAHLRAQPGDAMPNMFWVVFVWVSFVAAVVGARAVVVPMVPRVLANAETSSKSTGGWRAWGLPRALQWNRRRRGGSASSYNPRGLLWSLVHLAVGYSSLCLAAKIGVGQVPATATVKVSWTVFITWTTTVFGMLWSAYLWLVSRQPQQHCPAPRHSANANGNGNGPLDELANRINTTNLCFSPSSHIGGSSTGPFKTKAMGDGGPANGNVVKVGGVSPSPWRESVASLVLLAGVLAFLPAWKPLSGAATLPALLGPAVLALALLFVGLTVQMIRLPVLWCDRLKFLSLIQNKEMQPCRNCGRIE